ncbi:MAG: hypothetical protein IJ228_11015 [Succinivibrio sp.]|nr:hypothetical protein [Succinivibrio sp.]
MISLLISDSTAQDIIDAIEGAFCSDYDDESTLHYLQDMLKEELEKNGSKKEDGADERD